MQLLNKFNKVICFVLCVIEICSMYANHKGYSFKRQEKYYNH